MRGGNGRRDCLILLPGGPESAKHTDRTQDVVTRLGGGGVETKSGAVTKELYSGDGGLLCKCPHTLVVTHN